MGPVGHESYATYKDARWNEKTAAILLVAGILLIGFAPFLINNLIAPGTDAIMEKLAVGNK
jgi:NADH-quinone oxidoreductase subunit M